MLYNLPKDRLFPSGLLLATMPVVQSGIDANPYLARHFHGDWGDLAEADKRKNENALKSKSQIFSSYKLPQPVGMDTELWIITEADRSSTTLLFPSDY
jgi:hypothetical protein